MISTDILTRVPADGKLAPKTSFVEQRQEVINWLTEREYPALPVAPKQEGYLDPKTGKPKYTGKNPSYLGRYDRPCIVQHKLYQNKLPTARELRDWFSNPLVGVGTLGGFNHCVWLDFDVKQFDGLAACKEAVDRLLEAHPFLRAFVEETHSGGWRIGVKVKETPNFTNFALEEGGTHRGEALGKGRFTVLAPTVGVSGSPYVSHSRGELPEISSLEEIGIFPVSTKTSQLISIPFPKSAIPASTASVDIKNLVSSKIRELAQSRKAEDRSSTLTAIARECLGWEAWLGSKNISISGDPLGLFQEAVANLGAEDKADRILKSLQGGSHTPGVWYAKGDLGCWKKLKRVYRRAFEESAPVETQQEVEVNETEKTINQIIVDELYSDPEVPWICIKGELHFWTGTHYQKQDDDLELRRISEFCNSYSVSKEDKTGNVTYEFKYAKPFYVNQALSWVKQQKTVTNLELVNPEGLNCKNGVLGLVYLFDEKRFDRRFSPHSPEKYFTYVSDAEFLPKVDTTHCDRLLQALEPEFREIVLRTIGSAFALPTVRQLKGRLVRALLLHGNGSNGKDALREATVRLFGRGMVSASISDFKQYDQGRKFSLAKLLNATINWSSENADHHSIDRIQSLKVAITGETMEAEQKGKDGIEFTPKCILVFNLNGMPNLTAVQEAISSRFAIIPFRKTFVDEPKNSQEMKADSRFKYDPDWVATVVLPAFLLRLLDALDRLVQEGIDYSPTAAIMNEARKETNHLVAFCQDVGLVEDSEGWTTSDEVLDRLKDWYKAEGVLEISDWGEKWHELPQYGDKVIKDKKNLLHRLKDLFPKIEPKQKRIPGLSTPRRIWVGVKFTTQSSLMDGAENRVEWIS